ncbi:L7Ae/L30e/S12e/Gadd45 family ribosomal protein [Natronincola peptidivorans]|uniref:L7Ae/L30e/S12e/Gadd45 family ribosomal protein n=1 Tax=Natronincola peptidivorans TaxID=426128 RepID=UPI001FCCA7CC
MLVAGDASDNTRKTFLDKSTYYNVPIRVIATKEELGQCIGKSTRAVIAIKDKKFATTLLGYLDNNV